MADVNAPSIQPVELQDIRVIQDIARKTWTATYGGLIPEHVQERLLEDWSSTPGLDEVIRSDRTIFLLATVGLQPVGFAQFVQVSPVAASLSRIYVLPEHQNLRIGSRLLDAAVSRLKAIGVERVLVDVERDNLVGRRFYAHRSFVEVGESSADLADHQLSLVRCELAI